VNDTPQDIHALVARLKAEGAGFVLATVVRTVAATAAKAGAKAVILPDGTLHAGWIGGGCARGAVLRAARDALADGEPRLVSVAPEEVLAAQGVAAGEARAGVSFARSMCPSKGTTDIFIEPVLPGPELVVLGESPVAAALAGLAPRVGFSVVRALPEAARRQRFVVVATQGQGDMAALRAALAAEADYRAFVGSRAKWAALAGKLRVEGVAEDRLATLAAPAGLDIGAIGPEEIALSILAQVVAARRAALVAGGQD